MNRLTAQGGQIESLQRLSAVAQLLISAACGFQRREHGGGRLPLRQRELPPTIFQRAAAEGALANLIPLLHRTEELAITAANTTIDASASPTSRSRYRTTTW